MIRARVTRGACVAALALPCLAVEASAHAFQDGVVFYDQFLEGAGVVIGYPGILLPLLSLGLLVSLWDPDGMLRVWPVFAAGQIAGIPAAALAGPGVADLCLALGILTAGLAARLGRHGRAEVMGLAALSGALALAVSLEGHGLFELSVFIHLGLLLGVNLVVAVSAGLTRTVLDLVERPWMRIGWRVAASWLAAVQILLLAFAVAGPG